jgi:hypothetical protein
VAELERRLARQGEAGAGSAAGWRPNGLDRPLAAPPFVESLGGAAPLVPPAPSLDDSGQADLVEMGETDDW